MHWLLTVACLLLAILSLCGWLKLYFVLSENFGLDGTSLSSNLFGFVYLIATPYVCTYAVYFFSLLFRIIGLVVRIPRYLHYRYKCFWRKWTLPSRRLGWKSLRGFPDADTPLLSAADCSHDCQTTSKLCRGCFQIVERSRLLSAAFSIFIRRTEWYRWDVPFRGSDFIASKKSCQLCNILWYSLDEQTKFRLAGSSTLRQRLPVTYPCLWLSIWQPQNGGIYLALFDNQASSTENRRILCKAINIREEPLNGNSPSIHIPTWTGDCMELAKNWITDCQEGHRFYCSEDVAKRSDPYVPNRLLYIAEPGVLRLQEDFTLFAPENIKYLALSYSHSGNELVSEKLLTSNKKAEWEHQIHEDRLPLTFQHAVHLTRQLGLSFLWVDTLCIVQDSPEDQKLEENNLGKVFANAYCTIASSADASGGCFNKRTSPMLDFPCYLRFSKKKGLVIRANRHTYNSGSFSEEVDRNTSTLQDQGFLERLLSRRVLHLRPKFLFFECNTHIASEVMTYGQSFRELGWFGERFHHFRRRAARLHSNATHSAFNPVTGYRSAFNELRANRSTTLSDKEEMQLHKAWFELVSGLSKCKTTSLAERSTAISNLAREIQDGDEGLEYADGLWKRHLLLDLLWFIKSQRTQKSSSEHREKSWSWQTVGGEVNLSMVNHIAGKECSTMKVAELVTLDDDDSTISSPEEKDHLILKCPLLRCTDIFTNASQQHLLQLQTPEGTVVAIFMPDFSDFDRENLYGADIVRVVVRAPARTGGCKGNGRVKKGGVERICSHGVVLRRRVSEREQQGVLVTYERVGRFWLVWPLSRDGDEGGGDLRAGSVASSILRRKGGHVVRIV